MRWLHEQGDHVAFARVQIEVALQWCSDVFYDTTIGFANSIRTGDGGTHMEGMRAGVTRCINTLAKKQKLLKEVSHNERCVVSHKTCMLSHNQSAW